MAERLTTITFAARHKTKLTVCSFPFPCCFQVVHSEPSRIHQVADGSRLLFYPHRLLNTLLGKPVA
jgi:hypothetical protein